MITAQSDVGYLRRAIVKHARDAFLDQAHIQAQWSVLGYTGAPEFTVAVRQYDAFTDILSSNGCELIYQPADDTTKLDSIYLRDSSIVTDTGVILCNMGKAARQAEPAMLEILYQQKEINIIGRIEPPGCLEGGDVTWLTPRRLVVGESYRTNRIGIEQLTKLLANQVDEVIAVSLPHFRGPGDILHLMSLLSLVAERLAVVYSPLLPISLRNRLLELDFKLVEVPEEEFDSMGPNVLALGPDKCLAVAGNPVTRDRLERAGMEVICYQGNEISVKGCGGPTCLTRPLAWELPNHG